MGHKTKRIARNMGRIEFIACKDKIYSMLQTGYDIKKIHELLRERKLITMAYSTLCYQLAKHHQQSENKTDKKTHRHAQNKQTSLRTDYQSDIFSINKSPSTDDMI